MHIPVFPLAAHVVLPNVPQPYRLFEPRYVALAKMLNAKSAEERVLTIPCMKDDWQKAKKNDEPFVETALLVHVDEIEEMPNGEWGIIVSGHERYRLEEIPSDQPWREAKAIPFPLSIDMSLGALQQSVLLLSQPFHAFLAAQSVAKEDIVKFLSDVTDPVVLMHRIAHVLLTNPHDRQEFLEAPTASDRLRLLQHRLGSHPSPEPGIN